MRLIYNDALNKRIAPYLERLTKKRTSLDKETMTLLDVFMQYFNMDTRYGAYSDKLEPCIIYIIQEEKIKSVANLFDGKLNKLLRYLLGDEYAHLFHTYLELKARSVHSRILAPVATVGKSSSAYRPRYRCIDPVSETARHRIYGSSRTERRKHSGRNRSIQGFDELPELDGRPNSRRQPDCH